MAPSFKFPTPASCKLKDNAVLCTSDRILALYNQATGKEQKRITQPVKTWFAAEAQNNGWAGGHFLPEVQSGHGAGCVLFVPPREINVSVNVTEKTLVLMADED
ncbi:hypothetical protein [Marinobacterium arenosum]|uniref:hypothetical protein n=1 Tax=Marinobacterium arenosum TaxID=2862496 RepID=UPI001C95FB37|nr:hypothetical protein [Marinobacterium arenosum]MBY4676193.1 hypothetical protein [Marinobacterium arenosum]